MPSHALICDNMSKSSKLVKSSRRAQRERQQHVMGRRKLGLVARNGKKTSNTTIAKQATVLFAFLLSWFAMDYGVSLLYRAHEKVRYDDLDQQLRGNAQQQNQRHLPDNYDHQRTNNNNKQEQHLLYPQQQQVVQHQQQRVQQQQRNTPPLMQQQQQEQRNTPPIMQQQQLSTNTNTQRNIAVDTTTTASQQNNNQNQRIMQSCQDCEDQLPPLGVSDCVTGINDYATMCSNVYWTSYHICQYSCYQNGYSYPGEAPCCEPGDVVSSAPSLGDNKTHVPTAQPTTTEPTVWIKTKSPLPSSSPSTGSPTNPNPTAFPTTSLPSLSPSTAPSEGPSPQPTTDSPSVVPSTNPSSSPTTDVPSLSPSSSPSFSQTPSIAPTSSPSLSKSPTTSLSPSSTPTTAVPSGSPTRVAFLASGENAYNNTDPDGGPWSECLGWEAQDCRDYIQVVTSDFPKFSYVGVRWVSTTNTNNTTNNSTNSTTAEEPPTAEDDGEDEFNIDGNGGSYHWVGGADVHGNLIPNAYVTNPHRVVVTVNDDGIVVNCPKRG